MMGLLEDFGYEEEGDNDSYSPEEQEVIPAPPGGPTDTSALRRGGGNKEELRDAIVATANKLGISATDLATAISYETGGTLDPWKKGPTTQWGTHRGLIQWGEPQAKRYGVSADTSITDQLSAVGKYLTDAGVKAGMGLLDVYSAINAGRVGLYDRSDANNGGAPGSVRDKVNNQMGAHKKIAASLVGDVDEAAAYAAEPTASFPNYKPPVGPRRDGSAAGVGYISNNDGGWTPAGNEPPQAMFYGPVRQNTNQAPAYVRGANPGLQASYVPPEMRGPFRKVAPQPIVNLDPKMIIGQPTAPLSYAKDFPVNAAMDMPGVPLDEAPPIASGVAKMLAEMPMPVPPVDSPILDESAGLNLAKTASNISLASVDPVSNPEQAPEIPSPVLPNLPPKDQESLLVKKGDPDNTPRPTLPMSGDNIDVSKMSTFEMEEGKPEAVAKGPSSFSDMLNKAVGVGKDTVNMVKQVGSKAMGQGTALPFMAGAALTAVADQGSNTGGLTQWMLDQAQKMEEGADYQFGVNKTGQTLAEKGGAFLGKIFTPFGKNTALATGLTGIASLASDGITAVQAQELKLKKAEAENLMFPGTGNNNTSGQDVVQGGPLAGPRVTHTVATAAGPATLDPATYKLLGVVGAATLGAIIAPGLARSIISNHLPGRTARILENSPGTEAITNRMDVAHMAHDQDAALKRVARDIGTDPITMKNISDLLDFQSGSASRNLTNAAVVNGKMDSPNFSFSVANPIPKLATVEEQIPVVTDYLHLHHQLDEVRELQRVTMKKSQAAILHAGVPEVRGMNEWQIRQAIKTIEAGPDGQAAVAARQMYQENLDTTRQFMAGGEYSTMSKADLRTARRQQGNQIFQKLDIDNTNIQPNKSYEDLSTWMTKQLRYRMENEVRGTYIDNLKQNSPNLVSKIDDEIDPITGKVMRTAQDIVAKNKNSWGPGIVKFDRFGKTEIYHVDPLLAFRLNMDPYAVASTDNAILKGVGDLKQLMEKTTTGKWAPWFSATTAIRNHQLIRVSDMAGMRTPNILETAAAIPQQLYPQLAKQFSERLSSMSQGWLGTVVPQSVLDGVSHTMARAWDQSMMAALTSRGAVHTNMYLDYSQNAAKQIKQIVAAQTKTGAAGAANDAMSVLHGLGNLFEAVSNAPTFAYARKNVKRGANIDEVAQNARDIVGNHSKTGIWKKGGLPFVDDQQGIAGKIGTAAAQGVGAANFIGREYLPWFNVTTQGMKRLGKAYLDNPAKFVANVYQYQVLPVAATFLYARGLGTDPNGVSYNDYMMNHRSGYNSLMTMYIPIPGQPAEKGIHLPIPHELSVVQAVVNSALHHLTHSEAMSRGDDFMRAAASLAGADYQPSVNVPLRSWDKDFGNAMLNWGQTAFVPAMPPAMTLGAGMMGVSMPNGPFGEGFVKKNDPYDSFQGLNSSIEGVLRSLAPGVGDIIGAGYLAYTHDEKAVSGFGSGMKAMGRKATEKAPIVRDIIGWKPPAPGNTPVTEDMYKNKKLLDNIIKYYRKSDPTEYEGEVEKAPKLGKSKEGNFISEHFMPEAPPGTPFRMPQLAPKNEMYKAMIEELDTKLKTDTVTERGKGKEPTGGIGFPSHLDRYFKFTEQIKGMRSITAGNEVTFMRRLNEQPELKQYLENNDVNVTNPREVQNFLESKRQESARQILLTYKAIEQDFAHKLNKPDFKFDDLDPTKEMPLPPGFVPKAYPPPGKSPLMQYIDPSIYKKAPR